MTMIVMAVFQWGPPNWGRNQFFNGDPQTGAEIAIFGQYLVLESMTGEVSSVVNKFRPWSKFITVSVGLHL